jgi:hypothetical protein
MADIEAELNEVRSVYSEVTVQPAALMQGQRERLDEVGMSLEQKGGAVLVQQVLMDLRNAPENYSEEFLSELAAIWPTNSDPTVTD